MLTFDEALSRLLDARSTGGRRSTNRCRPWLHADRRVLAHARRRRPSMRRRSTIRRWMAMPSRLPMCRAVGICLPVTQRIVAGSVGSRLQPGSAARIFTGAPIPPGADAVVMQELCEHDAAARCASTTCRAVGEHIRRAGSDIAAGSEILACGQRLRPQDTALAASVGIASLPVFGACGWRCCVTGNELRMPGETLPPGAIYNANRFLLCGPARTARLHRA
jgi:molybdopterin molybdotransferase